MTGGGAAGDCSDGEAVRRRRGSVRLTLSEACGILPADTTPAGDMDDSVTLVDVDDT